MSGLAKRSCSEGVQQILNFSKGGDGLVISSNSPLDRITVIAALQGSGRPASRRSPSGELRGPVCGMGICFECRLEIDGRMHERSCNLPCRPGMVVRTAGAAIDGMEGEADG